MSENAGYNCAQRLALYDVSASLPPDKGTNFILTCQLSQYQGGSGV